MKDKNPFYKLIKQFIEISKENKNKIKNLEIYILPDIFFDCSIKN
jgi:hypothetical protein